MVKVVISGGSCEIAGAVVDHLLATKQHEIHILSRRDPKPTDRFQPEIPEIIRKKVEYEDRQSLVAALQGAHTVLCFIPTHLDPEGKAEKNLIHAAVEADTKRFAPSEWSVADTSIFPGDTSKATVREYLVQLNKDKTVLEYTLFQPGLVLEHLVIPSPRHAQPSIGTIIDIPNRRALLPDGGNDKVVLTSIRDIAATVTRALSHTSPWPVQGGIRGNLVSLAEVISLAERIHGGQPFHIKRLKVEDLRKDTAQGPLNPGQAQDPNQEVNRAQNVKAPPPLAHILLAITQGAFVVGDEWNIELASSSSGAHIFQTVEEFFEDQKTLIKSGKQSQSAEGELRDNDEEMEGVELDAAGPRNLA